MPYTDNLNQLFDVAAIEQQSESAISSVKNYLVAVTETSKKISELETSFFSNAAALSELAKLTKEAIGLTNEQAKSVKLLADAKLAEAKAGTEQSETNLNNKKAEVEEEKKLALEKKRTTEQVVKQKTEYDNLKKSYNENANAVKALIVQELQQGATLKTLSANTQKLISDLKTQHSVLSQSEQAVGQFQRQVGNYNVVGAQFNQLLRELPNAGISLQTFVMSLSNNISYFVEAVNTARAAGQSWGVIMSGLASSLMGPIGIINLLVLGVTMLSTSMSSQKDIMEEYREVVDKQAEALRKMNDELERAFKNNANEEMRQSLIVRSKNEVEALKAKGASLDEVYNKEQRVRQLELQSLRANYESIRATDAEKAYAIKLNILEKEGEIEAARLRRAKDASDALRQIRLDAQKAVNENEDSAELERLESEKNASKLIADNTHKLLQQRLDAVDKFEMASLGIQEIALQKELANLDAEEKAKSEKYASNAEALLLIEKEFHNKREIANRDYNIKANDITTAAAKMYDKAVEDEMTAAENAYKEKVRLAKKEQTELEKIWAEEARKKKKADSDELKERIKNIKAYGKAAAEILDGITAYSQRRTENELLRLQKEADGVDDNTNRQIRAVERTTLSYEEKQLRIDDINARAEQRKNQIAQQEAARAAKQADFDKGMAILKATLAMFVGVAQEIEKGGVIGIGTGAAVLAYMGGIIATLSNSQVPQYAEGTDHHKGGLAVVGDGGEHELINLPSGKQYMSPATDTLVNLPTGAQVIPLSYINDMSKRSQLAGLPILPMAYGDSQAVANAVIASNKEVVTAIINKKETHFTWHNGELRTRIKRGNTWTTYVNTHNK